MNILDAAYNIGHSYPGGAKLLAQRLGINQAVFNSKLNPNTLTHHLTLDEAHRMGQLAGRTDILEVMADDMGYALVKLPSITENEDISTAIRKDVGEFGRYMTLIDDTLSNGDITQTERKALEEEVVQVLARTQHLQALLSGMAINKRAPKFPLNLEKK